MKQTVLHAKHMQSKPKLMDFQGWRIPLQFSDALAEYNAVRTAAGLFDISFLGRIEVSGPGAGPLLQKVLTWNITKVAEGFAHYGLICNEAGGILDDVIVHHLASKDAAKSRYLLTTNAINTEKIFAWLKKNSADDVVLVDQSLATVHLSLQGPHSFRILENLSGTHFKNLKPRAIKELTLLDIKVILSHTGYTGEHGYEIIAPAINAENLWNGIMKAGHDHGLLPCGFASRDMLRMEMGYRLYGNDLDETRSPLEARLDAFVDFGKDFLGKEALLKQKTDGIKQKLAGFVLLEKGIPKIGGSIFSESSEIGLVTSGCQSPRLHNGIGLGYVVARYAQAGQEIEIEVKDREIVAKIHDLPFYKKK